MTSLSLTFKVHSFTAKNKEKSKTLILKPQKSHFQKCTGNIGSESTTDLTLWPCLICLSPQLQHGDSNTILSLRFTKLGWSSNLSSAEWKPPPSFKVLSSCLFLSIVYKFTCQKCMFRSIRRDYMTRQISMVHNYMETLTVISWDSNLFLVLYMSSICYSSRLKCAVKVKK